MKRIIIVDDDPDIHTAISLIFESSTYQLEIFPSAEPILNGDYELPDMFILDKHLNGTDGLVLCRHLKAAEHTRHIPVIMLSASNDIIRQAALAGAEGAIEKPFKMKALREMVITQLA